MRKLMRKKWLSSLLTLAMVLALLSGCGSNTEKTSADSDKNDSTTEVPDSNDSADASGDAALEAESFSVGGGDLKPLVSTTDLELSAYLVKAQDTASELYGYIDIRTGEFVIEPRFTSCDDAFGDDGWAVVREDVGDRQKNNQSVINTSGELLFAYDALGNYSADISNYGGGNILVCTSYDDVPPSAYLYHGSQLVRELEISVENCTGVMCSTAYYSDTSATKPYMPDHFIVISAEDNGGDWVHLWYDTDGNFIYMPEDVGGCLVGDETGYYYIGKGYIDVIAPDGSVKETQEAKSQYCGKVAWDGDNWYVIMNLTGEPTLYTNGLTPLFETREVGTFYYTLDVTDGIVRGQAGYWYTLDGTPLPGQQAASYGGPFRNGYAKACTKADVMNTLGGSEYHYVDMQGNKVFEIPTEQYSNYSSILKDGYFVYGQNEMYGIMNLDGTVVTEMRFRHIYDL